MWMRFLDGCLADVSHRILRGTLAGALLACAPAFAQARSCPGLVTGVTDAKFSPGQVWSYEPRTGEGNSLLTILRIDELGKWGVVIHVRVDGLQAHNPRGELVPSVEHMPFSRDALLGSVRKLVRTSASLPTLEGLEAWQDACGGVYTISVRDAVSVMERTLNSR